MIYRKTSARLWNYTAKQSHSPPQIDLNMRMNIYAFYPRIRPSIAYGLVPPIGSQTLASHRRKGYAVSVISAWASTVEKLGALPLYSTSIDNMLSQKVAARVGLSRYGVDFHIA